MGISITDRTLESAIESAPDVVYTSYGQLTQLDRILYYWAASEFFSGAGTIVDAGALVGGTTCIFGEGVRQNRTARFTAPPIHVYDLFEDGRDGYSATLIKGWYNENSSSDDPYDFERHFRRNTKAYETLLTVHKGDVVGASYHDERDIEVLSLDVAKNADLMLACAMKFFPRLIPDRSIVLHQDYIFPFQPWLHIAMELMNDLLYKVYDVATHCTAVFAPRRRITADDVRMRLGLAGSDYYHLGNVDKIYAAIDGARPGFGRFVHTAALSYFYSAMGSRKVAIQVALRMLEEMDPSIASVERAALGFFLQNDLGIDYKTMCR